MMTNIYYRQKGMNKMMNPQAAMQLLGALGTFRNSHPKFSSFLEIMLRNGIPEDTVIEMTITRPGEEPVTSNMKVTKSDLELFAALKGLKP